MTWRVEAIDGIVIHVDGVDDDGDIGLTIFGHGIVPEGVTVHIDLIAAEALVDALVDALDEAESD